MAALATPFHIGDFLFRTPAIFFVYHLKSLEGAGKEPFNLIDETTKGAVSLIAHEEGLALQDADCDPTTVSFSSVFFISNCR